MKSYPSSPIAIVGLSCRFPGARGPIELWNLLSEGRDAFSPLDKRWSETLIRPRKHEQMPPVPRAGLLESIQEFDAAFFGISPREATRMDPQQRILLELAWEAFEDAGIPAERYAGERVGVFVGFNTTDYWSLTTDSANRSAVDAWTELGGSPSILANRVSYAFDFRGPSVALDSACSASLLGVHLAKESLARGESRAALAGGITLLVRPEVTLGLARATMLSPTGESRPFSRNANGYVRGEGAGFVLLKRLPDALEDGDRIYAIIRGSGVSQDGHSAGITVPTTAGQSQMLELAYADAGIDPTTVRYVEAHGTGTPVGDPIEAQALGQVVGKGRAKDRPCVIGSIKSNIGHLEAAAGVAGLIKTLLCLENDRIVPSLASEPANEEIPFAELGLRVAAQAETLRQSTGPVVVGVSSFGFGGTNAHVVLESVDQNPPSRAEKSVERAEARAHLFPVSARSGQAVRDLAGSLSAVIRGDSGFDLGDVAHTLSSRRSHPPFRASVVAETHDALSEQLAALADAQAPVSEVAAEPGRIAFIFSGMGPQWWGMARRLLHEEPVFRECIERVDEELAKLSGWSLLERVFHADEDHVPSLVDRADIGHPAHFAVQMALCDLLGEWGIRPMAVVGHSAGEVSSACASGILSFEDSIRVLFHRSRLVQQAAGLGRMLATDLGSAEAEERVARYGADVCVAALNSPHSVTLSGRTDLLQSIAAELEAEGRFARFVPGCFPYHSPVFEPIRESLIAALDGIEPRAARIPAVSTASGGWAQGEDFGSRYWWRNVRDCVRFESAIRALLDAGHDAFLEIGAHPALLRSVRETAESSGITVCATGTLNRDGEDRKALLRSVGDLWNTGHASSLSAVGSVAGKLVRLPTYAWQHTPYWIEPPDGDASDSDHPVRGDRVAADRLTWQARVSTATPRWAVDHRINGEVLLPAVAWVEAWLSAALDQGAALPVSLVDIEFSELRPLSEQSSCLRIRHSGERWTFESAEAPDSDEWVLHGSAYRGRQPSSVEPIDLETVLAPLTGAPFDYDRYRDTGYEYSHSFRIIEEIWSGRGLAFARLAAVPQDVADGDYVLHPALFDGAMHTILGCIDRLDGLYLPMGFDEVTVLRRHDPEREPVLWTRAEIVQLGEGSISANLTVFGSNGVPVLIAQGARLRRAGRPNFMKQHWLYQERWVRAPSLIDGGDLRFRSSPPSLEMLLQASGASDQTPAHRSLDRLAGAYYLEALKDLNSTTVGDIKTSTEVAIGEGQIDVRYGKLARRLAGSVIRRAESSATLRRELTWRYPAWHLERDVLDRIGLALPLILGGKLDPHESIVSAQDSLLRLFYTDAESIRPAQQALRDAFASEVKSLREDTPVRILEIGAGTGSTTSWLLPVLDGDRMEYVFTDASPQILSAASERWRASRTLATGELDIGRDPEEQGYALHSFDILIASSGLYNATADLSTALRRCHRLLRPNGLLLLNEPVHYVPWLDVVFSILGGGWRSSDGDLRADHPIVDPQEWESLLYNSGFMSARSLEPARGGPLAVIAGRASGQSDSMLEPSLPRGDRWLFIGNDPAGTIMKEELKRNNRECIQISSCDQLPESSTSFDRVVYFSSRPSSDICSAPLDLIELAKWAEVHPVQLTIATRGAQRVPGEAQARNLDAAATWGFARVMANEHPQLDTRLVDLGPRFDPLDALALLEEIAQVGSQEGQPFEEEVALRKALRFVPRLAQPKPEDVHADSPASGVEPWRVHIGRPGDLGSISFRPHLRRDPDPHEIEIEVEFTSLNFHEVLLALGLITDEEEESGKEGLLGSDCVGTVLRVGSEVEGLSPGDRVVGLALGAFASHITGPACFFVRVPPGMSGPEAVTLPTVAATVEYALYDVARLRPGDTVLVHSGTGGVGMTALRWSQSAGARVLATAGSFEKRAWLRDLGVECVGDSHSLEFVDRTLEVTDGRGVDVVLNSLSGQALEKSASLLAPGGRFIELGRREIAVDRGIGLRPFARNGSIHVVSLQSLAASEPARVGALLHSALRRAESGEIGPLPHVQMPIARIEEAFRFMASGTHTGKVVLSTRSTPVSVQASPSRTSQRIRSNATYLITGGLGGLGLATARWLSRRGARQLVLLGRTGASSEESRQSVADLRREGVQVVVARGDVSSSSDVGRVLAEIEESMPPLKGVFHAAMTIEDSVVTHTKRDSLERVLAPKAIGARVLHEATADLDLDFFVLCSSISRALATPGQASYVAANEFLAALASKRRAMGKPATCIDWGVLEDVGYVSRNRDILDRLTRAGCGTIQSADALDAMGYIVASGAESLALFEFDWRQAERFFSRETLPGRYSLVRKDGLRSFDEHRSGGAALDAMLESTDPKAQEEVAIDFVRRRAASILRRSAETIGADIPLVDLGFDSLMEVELRVAIQRDTGLETTALKGMRGGTVRSVANLVLDRLGLGGSSIGRNAGVPRAFREWIGDRERALGRVFDGDDLQVIGTELEETLRGLSLHVSHLSSFEHAAHREAFSERLARFFLESAFLRRAKDKPLGYAGDYDVMNQIYQNEPQGTGIQAAVDSYALQRPLCNAVRYRSGFFLNLLKEFGSDRTSIRVANIGCGPAREMRVLIDREPDLARRVEAVLVDQDERALAECRNRLGTGFPEEQCIEYVCATVESLADRRLHSGSDLGQFDLVWSCGLFDYFNEQNFLRYLQAVYDLVLPSGRLAVGNIASINPDRWTMEYVSDWFIHLRSVDDLVRYAEALSPAPSSVAVEADPAGIQLFLVLNRPGTGRE